MSLFDNHDGSGWIATWLSCDVISCVVFGYSYLLFPLVMLLDAAVACREKKGVEGHRRLNVGDKVAEGVVVCLRAVLEKCPCQSVSQVPVLQIVH